MYDALEHSTDSLARVIRQQTWPTSVHCPSHLGETRTSVLKKKIRLPPDEAMDG